MMCSFKLKTDGNPSCYRRYGMNLNLNQHYKYVCLKLQIKYLTLGILSEGFRSFSTEILFND